MVLCSASPTEAPVSILLGAQPLAPLRALDPVQAGARDSASLTSSQVMLTLLVADHTSALSCELSPRIPFLSARPLALPRRGTELSFPRRLNASPRIGPPRVDSLMGLVMLGAGRVREGPSL